jgi:hypothetical protein
LKDDIEKKKGYIFLIAESVEFHSYTISFTFEILPI